jgi:TolA-binding protein
LHKRITLLLVLVAGGFLSGCGKSAPWAGQAEPVDIAQAMADYRDALKRIDKLEYATALVKLERVSPLFDQAGDGTHAAESLFWLGFCREKLQYEDMARETYVDVIERYPLSKPAKYAKTRLDAMNQPS